MSGLPTWLNEVPKLLGPEYPASALVAGPASTAVHNEPDPEPAGPLLCCLYCGSNDDIYETRVIVDDRTDEYVLTCGHCHGVWAA